MVMMDCNFYKVLHIVLLWKALLFYWTIFNLHQNFVFMIQIRVSVGLITLFFKYSLLGFKLALKSLKFTFIKPTETLQMFDKPVMQRLRSLNSQKASDCVNRGNAVRNKCFLMIGSLKMMKLNFQIRLSLRCLMNLIRRELILCVFAIKYSSMSWNNQHVVTDRLSTECCSCLWDLEP